MLTVVDRHDVLTDCFNNVDRYHQTNYVNRESPFIVLSRKPGSSLLYFHNHILPQSRVDILFLSLFIMPQLTGYHLDYVLPRYVRHFVFSRWLEIPILDLELPNLSKIAHVDFTGC